MFLCIDGGGGWMEEDYFSAELVLSDVADFLCRKGERGWI